MDSRLPPSEKTEMKVNPAVVRFTQVNVGSHFQAPRDHFSLNDAVQKIESGVMSADDFPKLNVISYKVLLWSLDNRRLWVFRNAGCDQISVVVSQKMHPRLLVLVQNPSMLKRMAKANYEPTVRPMKLMECGLAITEHETTEIHLLQPAGVPQRTITNTVSESSNGKSARWIHKEVLNANPNPSEPSGKRLPSLKTPKVSSLIQEVTKSQLGQNVVQLSGLEVTNLQQTDSNGLRRPSDSDTGERYQSLEQIAQQTLGRRGCGSLVDLTEVQVIDSLRPEAEVSHGKGPKIALEFSEGEIIVCCNRRPSSTASISRASDHIDWSESWEARSPHNSNWPPMTMNSQLDPNSGYQRENFATSVPVESWLDRIRSSLFVCCGWKFGGYVQLSNREDVKRT